MKKLEQHIARVGDKIAVLGELEHIRRHACRSAVVASTNGKDYIKYQITAKHAEKLRRELMRRWFGLDDLDHCLCKSGATLRQLMYEVNEGDTEMLSEADALVDKIWSEATGIDMTGCKICAEDKEAR